MSKSKELEQHLERSEQQLRLLQKISRYMVRDIALEEVLKGVVTLVVEFMACDSCLLYLLDDNELVLRAANPPHPAIGKVKLALTEGLTGWVARERRLLSISREAYHDHCRKGWRAKSGRANSNRRKVSERGTLKWSTLLYS